MSMTIHALFFFLVVAAWSCIASTDAFQPVTVPPCWKSLSSSSPCRSVDSCTTQLFSTAANRNAAIKSTLTDETVWKLSVVLRSVETEQGKKVDEIFTSNVNFVEEVGFEPPQGSVEQVKRENQQDRLKIINGRWKLSEDPNDRKDGLWVWGLFKEPLYPFMLLQMETQAIPLPGSSKSSDDEGDAEKPDAIKPLTLYAQINHKRDDDLGVVLEASDLNVRQVESIKADPFGAAKVDIFEDVSVGTISIQPVRE